MDGITIEHMTRIKNGVKCSCSWCSLIHLILNLKTNDTDHDFTCLIRFDECFVKRDNINISPECLKCAYVTSATIDNSNVWEKTLCFFFDSLKYNPTCSYIYETIPLILITQNRDKDCLSFIKYWMHILTGWIDYDESNAYGLYNSGSWAYGNSAMANIGSLTHDMLTSLPTDPVAMPLPFLLAMSIIKVKIIIKRYAKIKMFKIFCSTDFGVKVDQVHSLIRECFMNDEALIRKSIQIQVRHIKKYFHAIQENDIFLLPYFLQCQCSHSKIYHSRRKSNKNVYLHDLYRKYASCCALLLRDVCDEEVFFPEMFSSVLLDCDVCARTNMFIPHKG